MPHLSMHRQCSGCKNTIADESDMLVEITAKDETVCVHVDHVTLIGLQMRTRLYGPYCNEECWKLDARPDDVFVDAGRFRFSEEVTNNG